MDAETENQEQQAETQEATATATEPQPEEGQIPEFEQFAATKRATGSPGDLNRFSGVQVVLTAELGRAQMSIQELIALAEGSVVELNRPISAPVELVAQGVPLGNGEVVVVEDQFAIRIKQIYAS
jgi:flagellar motor switch protein FliN/FliY